MNWTLSHHAELRMSEMRIERDEVLEALTDPSITYPSPPSYGPGRSVAVGGRLAVVVHSATRTVITVLWHGRSGRSFDPRAA